MEWLPLDDIGRESRLPMEAAILVREERSRKKIVKCLNEKKNPLGEHLRFVKREFFFPMCFLYFWKLLRGVLIKLETQNGC